MHNERERKPLTSRQRLQRFGILTAGVLAIPAALCMTRPSEPSRVNAEGQTNTPAQGGLCEFYGQEVTFSGQLGEERGTIVDASAQPQITTIGRLYAADGSVAGYAVVRGEDTTQTPPVRSGDFRVIPPTSGSPFNTDGEAKQPITITGEVSQLRGAENTCVITPVK